MSSLDINQEQMVPILGLVDMRTMDSGVITVMVDSAQVTPLIAGQFVKFVSSNTGPYPMVVAAAQGDKTNGVIPYQVKDATFNAGDKLEIMFFGGNVVWLQATAVAITPGSEVETDATGLLIQLETTNPVRGWALDYIPASGLGRVILAGELQSH